MSGREADLERRLAALLVENRRLRNLLKVTHGVEPPPEQPVFATEDPGLVTNDSSQQAKLDLYLNRFAARTDVYAYYWENPRKKTKGWSPKVRDPFGRGTMWDRRPLPLTRDVIEAHLRADDDLFVGLYPLLRDATCWWLAVDFDGPQAMLDAHAYIKAAHSLGVPCGLEVSQSGRGAHVWTFFTAPVSAATARAMGTACVHRAMGLRGSMPLASYDRMFPNQDTVPAGASGAGNLIAAPLNGQRRRDRRTTLFVDLATWEPWPDQWECLSTLARMTPAQVAAVARNSRLQVGSDVRRLEPSPATAIQPRPPAEIPGVLGAKLTLPDEALTPQLAAALRHAATIHNPAFYEAQRARRSTWNIPRFIQGFDVTLAGDLVLPRGLLARAAGLIAEAGSQLVVDDARSTGTELDLEFRGELTEQQTAAVDALLAHEDGILHAPTGSGKTVMACAVIAERSVSTLILVDKKVLADQWRAQIKALLGIKPGQLGGGRQKLGGRIDVVLLPTLARRPVAEIRELTAGYGQVIVDECHHGAAATYDHTLGQIPATWWLGLTATPERRDGLEELTTWQLGPIRHAVRDSRPEPGMLPMTDHALPRLLRVHETGFRASDGFDLTEPGAISALYGTLAADVDRNRQIADDVREALDSGRRCLVLSRRRDHLDALADLLSDRDPTILRGGTSRKDMDRFRERIADVEPGVPLLVLATLPFAGEGFDAPILDAVFLVAPISFPGILVQAVGRVLRRHPDKTDVVVHDYVDDTVPVLAAQYARRRQAYDHLGFHRG